MVLPFRGRISPQAQMNFCIKAKCEHGELVHRRTTAQAALRKARELARSGCYDVHIVTPEGRDYASSEFGDLPPTLVKGTAATSTRAGPLKGGGGALKRHRY